MRLLLQRIAKKSDYTVGRLFVDGKYLCNTLEDRVRDLTKEKKVPGETAIPAGRYRVIVNVSPKFGRELPRLLDVPGFEGILIHRGNYADYSEYGGEIKPASIHSFKDLLDEIIVID